jgi:predicted ABC-type ATPase
LSPRWPAARSCAYLRALKSDGWRVAIYYFALRSPALAVRRVRLRVRLGGHDVPEETVRRRFGRSLANLFGLYLPLADQWAVLDNSSSGKSRVVATHNDREGTRVEGERSWQRLRHLAHRRRNGR